MPEADDDWVTEIPDAVGKRAQIVVVAAGGDPADRGIGGIPLQDRDRVVPADRPGTGLVASWWPGAKYVTWVGIDGYYYLPSDTFAGVFGKTIAEVRALTRKPVLLSETGVGPKAGQFLKIQDLFRGMRQYQTIGLMWFDIAQHDGLYHQDWRIENSAAAEAAFRLGASSLTLAPS